MAVDKRLGSGFNRQGEEVKTFKKVKNTSGLVIQIDFFIKKEMRDFREFLVYKKAYELAMGVFNSTRRFPKHEAFSMTDQIRRCSRSVCALLAEAFRRKDYPAYFRNKIMEADGENSETAVWLDFSKDCQYLDEESYRHLSGLQTETGNLIGAILRNPERYRS